MIISPLVLILILDNISADFDFLILSVLKFETRYRQADAWTDSGQS